MVGYFETFDVSSTIPLDLDELSNTKPRVITGDYLKDAVYIGDNTTNKIIKALYDSVIDDVVSDASITVINFVEDIVVNR